MKEYDFLYRPALLLLFLFPMLGGCWCTYDITYRVSGTADNVDIEYSTDGDTGRASGVDLTAGPWYKKDELVDFIEGDCQEDDPWTEEDESDVLFCQEEDATFEISLRATNRTGSSETLTLEIFIDGDRATKRTATVSSNRSISATYYLDDAKK